MHKRKQIRQYVIDTITNGFLLGGRVFSSRTYPLGQEELPGACVYCTEEESNRQTINGGSLHRNLAVRIDVYVTGTDVDDQADDIAEEIEAALNLSLSFGGLVVSSLLSSTQIEFDDEGAEPIGRMSLTYEVLYIT